MELAAGSKSPPSAALGVRTATECQRQVRRLLYPRLSFCGERRRTHFAWRPLCDVLCPGNLGDTCPHYELVGWTWLDLVGLGGIWLYLVIFGVFVSVVVNGLGVSSCVSRGFCLLDLVRVRDLGLGDRESGLWDLCVKLGDFVTVVVNGLGVSSWVGWGFCLWKLVHVRDLGLGDRDSGSWDSCVQFGDFDSVVVNGLGGSRWSSWGFCL